MTNKPIFYRRNLPHIHPEDTIFFITFRLAGSLPTRVIQSLNEEKESKIKMLKNKYLGEELQGKIYAIEKRSFARYDELLERYDKGPLWLKEESIGRIVTDKIHEQDSNKYKLIAYCIMPNHVHLLIDTTDFDKGQYYDQSGKTKNYPLTDALRLLKGSTARLCNIQLGRSGAFWHHESYDHYVRNGEELARIIRYILNNPVKAGLVDDWQDWKFGYYDSSFST